MPLELFISQPVLITSTGEGLGQLTSPSVEAYRHESLLTDKKVLKTISKSASFGLASLNRLQQVQKLGTLDNPYRRGLFSAAPAPYTSDKDSYFSPAREASVGENPLQSFGKLFEGAAPTTGVVGLPNGVMCFAAQLLQSLGPHGTYVSRECSVHTALSAGIMHKKLGRIDDFVVFGFAQPSEKYSWESLTAIAAENKDVMLPNASVVGGFSCYLNSNASHFATPPLAKIVSTGPVSQLNLSKRPDIVLISSLSLSAKKASARLFDGAHVVDYYSHFPYLAEMSGVLEIAHAKTLSTSGVIPEHSLGIVICTDIFGHSSFLEFELFPEYAC